MFQDIFSACENNKAHSHLFECNKRFQFLIEMKSHDTLFREGRVSLKYSSRPRQAHRVITLSAIVAVNLAARNVRQTDDGGHSDLVGH